MPETTCAPYLAYRAFGVAWLTAVEVGAVTVPVATPGRGPTTTVTLPADAPGRGWGVLVIDLIAPTGCRVLWRQRVGLS